MARGALLAIASTPLGAAFNNYLRGSVRGNVSHAKAWCAENGYEIASIFDEAENELAQAACGESSFWIGLTESDGDWTTHAYDQVWVWPNGTVLDTSAFHM